MEAPRSCSTACSLFALALVAHWCSMSMATCTFTISNYCHHPIWPGTLAGAGTPQLPATGFRLDPGQAMQVPAPTGWSGRVWARTGCDFDARGAGKCQTGDCGGRMECGGTGGTPPVTLFEVTLGKGAATDQDYYDVSLVDGYNLPVVAVPRARQGGGCNTTGCTADLNLSCPKELQVDGGGGGGPVACRSACEAFGQDKYCCSGAYATPATCRPTAYSSIFKSACPRAYSYAYDDGTSTFTCNAVDYTIAFCLPPTGLNNPSVATPLGAPPPTNGQSNGGDANSAPPTDNNGAGSAYQPPSTGDNGAGTGSANSTPPPTDNSGAGSAYQPPPTSDNGAGSAYQPPTGDNGAGTGSANSTPPPTDNSGAGSAYQPPPTGDNGAGTGSANSTPPPIGNSGAGSANQPPPTGNNGAGGIYQQPWMLPSSASTRYNQLWILLPAVLLFLSDHSTWVGRVL